MNPSWSSEARQVLCETDYGHWGGPRPGEPGADCQLISTEAFTAQVVAGRFATTESWFGGLP